jgi:hypothetical protein
MAWAIKFFWCRITIFRPQVNKMAISRPYTMLAEATAGQKRSPSRKRGRSSHEKNTIFG